MARNRKRRLNNKFSRFQEYKQAYGMKVKLVRSNAENDFDFLLDILGTASLEISNKSRIFWRIHGYRLGDAVLFSLSQYSRIFSTKTFIPQSPLPFSTDIDNYCNEYLPTTLELLEMSSLIEK